MLQKQSNEEKTWYGFHIEKKKSKWWENIGCITNCKLSI